MHDIDPNSVARADAQPCLIAPVWAGRRLRWWAAYTPNEERSALSGDLLDLLVHLRDHDVHSAAIYDADGRRWRIQLEPDTAAPTPRPPTPDQTP